MKDSKSIFICQSWLGIGIGDGRIDRTFTATNDEEMKDAEMLFLVNASKGIADDHIWFSILMRPPRNQFTRCQRVSCCLSTLLCTMLANAMFYQTDKVVGATIDLGSFKFSWTQIMIGIQSAFIAFPINLLIVTLFRMSTINLLNIEPLKPAIDKNEDFDAIGSSQKRKKKRKGLFSGSNEIKYSNGLGQSQVNGTNETKSRNRRVKQPKRNVWFSTPTTEDSSTLSKRLNKSAIKKRSPTDIQYDRSSKNRTASLKESSVHSSKTFISKSARTKPSIQRAFSSDDKYLIQARKNARSSPDKSIQDLSKDVITESAIFLTVGGGTNSIGESCFYLLNAFSVFQSFFFQRDELCLFF